MRNFLHCGFRQKSFFIILNGKFFLIRRTTAKTTLTAWAKTVAIAAPAALMWNRRKQVVSDDKEDSATADTDVNSSQFDSFSRCLHQDCNRGC